MIVYVLTMNHLTQGTLALVVNATLDGAKAKALKLAWALKTAAGYEGLKWYTGEEFAQKMRDDCWAMLGCFATRRDHPAPIAPTYKGPHALPYWSALLDDQRSFCIDQREVGE